MAEAHDVEVLIAGAGPIGLTAALDLTRRGIDCRIVDPLAQPPQYAKAVGVQPRTLEVFEGMGVLHAILDASIPMYGQWVYVNGTKAAEQEMAVPTDIPFGFVAIPQYETERVLREELTNLGVSVERGLAVTGFTQGADGVSVNITGNAGTQQVRARYLIGADGAHSAVRKGLGLSFEGGAFEEQYMLGDVEVDWSVPPGYGVRSMHQTDGKTDDVLVCIPLPGRGRYRMSMLVPPELAGKSEAADGIAHGFEGDREPGLEHVQAVLDRLAPEPTTARNLRWSSVFRISHRLAGSYGKDRVFIAGDAAHIHPPTGAQGMNTGIQDAHNLTWKLALAVRGEAAAGLTDTYSAERHPVGEEVVGRTVRSAREGIGADSTDPDFIIRREAQLLISYAGSPIVGPDAGHRAPDARGLVRPVVTDPVRLFTLLNRRDHTLLFYVGAGTAAGAVPEIEAAAAAAVQAAHGRVDVHVIAAPTAELGGTVLSVIRDGTGDFAKTYGLDDAADRAEIALFVVRPDGYLGYVAADIDPESLVKHLRLTFA